MHARFLTIGVLLVSCLLLERTAAADSAGATSKPAEDSPKAALRAQDAAAHAGKINEDEAFFQTETEPQQKFAHVLAEADVAVARLQKAVQQKFSKELALAAVHALEFKDDSDIEAATEKIDGDKATITFKSDPSALPMVRVGGKWKIALPEELKQSDAAQLQQAVQKLTDQVRQITQLVEAGKFRSGEGVRDRLQDLHDNLFGAGGK